tara:strand:- start:573 stop:1022 length:450 start_codon:yes stop_codon:yes gene_type:complete
MGQEKEISEEEAVQYFTDAFADEPIEFGYLNTGGGCMVLEFLIQGEYYYDDEGNELNEVRSVWFTPSGYNMQGPTSTHKDDWWVGLYHGDPAMEVGLLLSVVGLENVKNTILKYFGTKIPETLLEANQDYSEYATRISLKTESYGVWME